MMMLDSGLLFGATLYIHPEHCSSLLIV